MERILARLERKLGRYAIERLTVYLVGAMAVGLAIAIFRPEVLERLVLDPHAVPREPWRLVTFLAIPRTTSLFWGFISLMFLHFVGTSLEANWGAFKFNVYYLVGVLTTIAAAFVTGQPQTNAYLNESLLLAVATIAPDFEILLLVLPVRLKWVGLFAFVVLVAQFVTSDMATRIAIGASFVNYLLFFSGHLLALLRGRRLAVRQAARRASFRPPPTSPATKSSARACAICGARQDDGADIRVCSCEKCGGPRELCLAHARDH